MQMKSAYRQPDSFGEECGIFGVFGVDRAAGQIHRGLFSLQHRGQEGCGIVVSDGNHIRSHKGQGLVSEVFADQSVIPQEWDRGIGHVRYSTTGSTRIYNVQPLVVECVDGIWALAHNGNLTNADRLRRMYQDAGAIFQTSTDSEVLVHILADPMFRRRPQRVARALAELRGAFAFLIMTKDCVMAARDPYGFRPLSIGKLGDGYVFASETCAMAQTGAEYLRDVEPGELVTVDETGLHSSMFADPPEHKAHCVFEMVYFARPDSVVFGNNAHGVRMQYGACLAKEHPVEADIVIPVPDSGNSAALGYSRASGIPFDFGFIRNHYIGRTFIMPQAEQRAIGVDLKLAVLPEVVRGKRVVVVDDSIVRGTTVQRRVTWLRSAGAKEVHVRISCPPVAHPCFYGIDFPTREELIAGGRTVEDIREFIGADSLGYLSEEGLLSPFENASDYCKACFSGHYPLSVEGLGDKHRHESVNPELPFER
ncbi:MAG: amidophosphoribosyltransferase [Kiritimatiellia bacterium]|jgi:amidophosphoribosyltransferase|nr:amidophosphoribosyltransferase [Kiritimatiellia bacterium]MDP6631400.1 amidophosphoribosyltransferase [Kiritimatiellia bacterium]MDP6809127.1 amidophosphoribosyltransferase [Kiritimatiellia bacterium]MDP7023181.1 amidophosphoribosyltransferase [Kiritimatiellia bacterium]